MEIEVQVPINQRTGEPIPNFRYVNVSDNQRDINILIGLRGMTTPPTKYLYEASIVLTFDDSIRNYNIDKNRFGRTYTRLDYIEAFRIVMRTILLELDLSFVQWREVKEIIENVIVDLDSEIGPKNNFSHKFNVKKLFL